MRVRAGIVLCLGLLTASTRLIAQAPPAVQPPRDATRDKLSALLETAGKRGDVNVVFRQSTKNLYNFVGTMNDKMANADSLEIVISVTPNDTIGFRIYHYKGGYINLKKATDAPALMHKLLVFNDHNFLFWGADSTDDIFCGYTFTLESGFPSEAVVIVLRSIRASDKFVGELRPSIDGTAAPAQ